MRKRKAFAVSLHPARTRRQERRDLVREVSPLISSPLLGFGIGLSSSLMAVNGFSFTWAVVFGACIIAFIVLLIWRRR
jgi:hypothetical protein